MTDNMKIREIFEKLDLRPPGEVFESSLDLVLSNMDSGAPFLHRHWIDAPFGKTMLTKVLAVAALDRGRSVFVAFTGNPQHESAYSREICSMLETLSGKSIEKNDLRVVCRMQLETIVRQLYGTNYDVVLFDPTLLWMGAGPSIEKTAVERTHAILPICPECGYLTTPMAWKVDGEGQKPEFGCYHCMWRGFEPREVEVLTTDIGEIR